MTLLVSSVPQMHPELHMKYLLLFCISAHVHTIYEVKTKHLFQSLRSNMAYKYQKSHTKPPKKKKKPQKFGKEKQTQRK